VPEGVVKGRQVFAVCLSSFRYVSSFAECSKKEEGGTGLRSMLVVFSLCFRASQSARRREEVTTLRKRACRVFVVIRASQSARRSVKRRTGLRSVLVVFSYEEVASYRGEEGAVVSKTQRFGLKLGS